MASTLSRPQCVNVFSHWLRLCTARDRKKAHIYFLFQMSDNWAFCTEGQTCTKVSHSHYLLSCYKSGLIFSKSCNEPAKRKRLGRSGTFMAQWFRRWTLESATRVRSPHGPLQSYCLTCEYDFHFGLLRQCQLVNVGRIQQLTQLGHCNTKPGG